MSLTQFQRILRENHQLTQLLEDYPEHPEQYIRSFMLRINGKQRKIITYQSDDFGNGLRQIHQMLAYAVRGIYVSSVNSYAYKEDVSVLSALEKHLSSKVFLKTDIHAYFDSIDFDAMLNFLFQKRPTMQKQKTFWSKVLATCFHEGHLPIGFVSSPILSDLYLNDLDQQFSGIKGIQYTRYADDIIFSSNANDAKEKLREVQGNLTSALASLHLEPNKKKTYIRTLKQEGDAIHLLGLNLVRTSDANNRITVSDWYIRQTSLEFSELLQEKDQIEERERQERFCQIAGKIGYIRHASSGSAEKLKKMIQIKTGIDTDLTYKSLVKLCLSVSFLSGNAKPDLPKKEHPHQSIQNIPVSGRIREEVHIPAESDPRIVAALRYYLYHLCLDIESETSGILLSKAVLRIGENINEIKGSQVIPSFMEHLLRLRKSRDEIHYAAEYRYQDGTSQTTRQSTKTRKPKKHMPIYTMPRIPAHGFIYDDENNNYSTFGSMKRTRVDLNDPKAVTHLVHKLIPLQNHWQGLFRMELRWPKSTDAQTEEQIQKFCLALTKIPGIHEEETDFPGRHFVCVSEKQMTNQALQKLICQLIEMDKVICELNGRSKIHSLFKPASPFEPTEINDFWCIEINQRVTSNLEITYQSFD